MANYDFVVDSSFKPFSLQEMLVPYTAYKDAFENVEAAYIDLSDKSDKFKYLSKTLPEGSKAREIYEGYANDLSKQAEDLAKNGLTLSNRRALTNMKRRYQGEIGRLVTADEALQRERELRRQMSAKDPSMMYADEILNIDSYLDGNTPNLYGISGTELYTKGAAAGKAASSRVFSAGDKGSTLGGYYRDYVQSRGYTPEQLRQFGSQISDDFSNWATTNIPDLGLAANQILEANGVNENLTGNNLRRAQQQVIRGIIDGAVYTESHNPQRDLGVLTESEKQGFALQREEMDRQAAAKGLTYDAKNKTYTYDIRRDPKYADELWKYQIDDRTGQVIGYSKAYEEAVEKGLVKVGKGSSSGNSKGKSGTSRYALNKGIVALEWKTENRKDAAKTVEVTEEDLKNEDDVTSKTYDDLTVEQQAEVDKVIGPEANHNLYEFRETPHKGGVFTASKNRLYVIPRNVKVGNANENEGESGEGENYNE